MELYAAAAERDGNTPAISSHSLLKLVSTAGTTEVLLLFTAGSSRRDCPNQLTQETTVQTQQEGKGETRATTGGS